MSYDTNLHRTFDYQLSSASLRIIDWAPVRAVVRSVLQTDQSAKAFTLVKDATPNTASVEAMYVQQEKRHHAHGRRGRPSISTVAAAVAAPRESLLVNETSGASDVPSHTTASPYHTHGQGGSAAPAAGNHSGGSGQMEHHAPQAEDLLQQPQRKLSDTWGVTGGEPSGEKVTGAAAAVSSTLLHTQDPSTETASVVATPQTTLVAGGGSSSSSNAQRVVAATSTTAADSPQRTHESSAPSVSPPLLTKGVWRCGTAGIMYGFDSVYHKNSFGVLVGLFTGAGYNQVHTFYRQRQSASPRHQEPSRGGHNGGARTPAGAQGTLPDAATAGVPAPQSGLTTNLDTNCAPPDQGPSGALDISVVDDAADLKGRESTVSHRLSLLNPWDGGVAVASQRLGQLKMYNALQIFWYWGARRWTGVLNVRLTPLPSGDALLPVCEYVTRTVMTECSIVIDDPVVYMHGFVVMLGRRTRTAEELRALHAAGTGGSGNAIEMGPAHDRAMTSHDQGKVGHFLGTTTAASATTGTWCDSQDTVTPPPGALGDGVQPTMRNSVASSTAEALGSTNLGRTLSSPQATAPAQQATASLASLSGRQHRSPPGSNNPTVDWAESNSTALWTAQPNVATPSGTTSVHKENAASLPEWLYWFQRCVLETTDEWLWNRAASEVSNEASCSSTPWWKPRHIKMGVGMSFRYRKPRGVNVYWGWGARVGRSLHFSGHIDVLRRMSCAVSSTFGFLDFSVRLRVNLVTLHQTALDAGVCWRPLPQVHNVAVRLATSANGTTLGVEIADLAPTLYGPVISRLSDWRSRRHSSEPTEPQAHVADCGKANSAAAVPSTYRPPPDSGGAALGTLDSNREDLVGLLPVTWHCLQQAGSTITSVLSSTKGAVMNALDSVSSAGSDARSISSPRASDSLPALQRQPVRLSLNNTPATPATLSTLPVGQELSRMALPAGKASLSYAKKAWHAFADFGWLENMLRTSHVNVSVGVTSVPNNKHREWSLFLIITEK